MRLATATAAVALFSILAPAPAAAQPDEEQTRPDGWMIRADRSGADTSEIFFVDMPPGWHVTTGPAVIL